jgi:hypothetical protein
MATQTVEFPCVTGQTVTAKLFSFGSDTEVASVSATEATNRKGLYSAAFTDVAAGTYRLIALTGTTPLAAWDVTLTLSTATFQVFEVGMAASLAPLDSKIDTIDNLIDTEIATLTTEVGKIPKQGETRRYTQIAADEGNKTADVSIGAPL